MTLCLHFPCVDGAPKEDPSNALATLKTDLFEEMGIEVLHFLLTHLLLPSNPYQLPPVVIANLRRILREGTPSIIFTLARCTAQQLSPGCYL